MLDSLSAQVKQYLIVTFNYWAFTLTDGALRMLVVLHFHHLGYSPLQVAMLFLFYEIFGIVTNLFGGWLGARIGLNRTMNLGLFLQIIALSMLMVPTQSLTVIWVMAAQAFSGIAKDLNKMSAKSSIKMLVSEQAEGQLFRWIALLTGSKNALKGFGFFLGGALLAVVGFKGAMIAMAAALTLVWLFSLYKLKQDLGRAKNKPKFKQIFSKSRAINVLSAARLFLFASRDTWFVVALPVFLASQFNWDHWKVGGFLAIWVIGYGVVQSIAPKIVSANKSVLSYGNLASFWAFCLAATPLLIILLASQLGLNPPVVVIGLIAFGVAFAINSSLHSFLIVDYAQSDGVSLDVGFYYMANAAGRLLGTILSGWVYQAYGLITCLWVSAGFIIVSACLVKFLPDKPAVSISRSV